MSGRKDQNQDAALAQLEEARAHFAQTLREYEGEFGKIYLDRVSELPQELLEECTVLHNRYELLDRLEKDAIVAEVGTDRGAFAAEILKLCRPRELHIFDIDFSKLDRANINSGLASGTCQLHEGDSSTQMTLMDDQYFDWIYIDADHFYDGVKKDIAACVPKLKPGGILVFNDYNVWSPLSAVKYGVAKAVHEFCIEHDWKFVYFALQSLMYNDVAITKR